MLGETTVAGTILRANDTDDSAWPSPARVWFAVGLFHSALIFSLIDRQILSLLVVPIKRDLVNSDTHMRLLMGFAFALFYIMVGVPIGRLADVQRDK